jgi:4-amino-4-deoxy-L-arabinose transferase-like glycosyltransferase
MKAAWAFALLLSAALLAAPWWGHIDDVDAQLYLVVARNMARDHSWFDLRYLPGVFPRFREHLPFGFWPAAAAIRVFGEWAVAPLYAFLTLAAIVFAGRIARRTAGEWAGVAAVVLLGTCESIWQYGGRLLLEPPLLLFATAAAGAALADRFVAAALLGATAALIKGPFGLLPLACVALARLDRRALLAVVAAALPLALFLGIDPSGGWRSGYLHGQLLASASGARADGVTSWWFPLRVIVGRFWPGLPIALLGLWRARRDARLRPLAIACLLTAALLCLPHRKWGNHAYVAFPLLAALAGAAAGPLLEKLRPRLVAATLAGAAALAWALALAGLGARVLQPPCPFSTGLRAPLDALHPRRPILVVAPNPDMLAIGELAAERDLVPWPEQHLPDPPTMPDAIARDETPVPHSWAVVAREGGWSVLRKR